MDVPALLDYHRDDRTEGRIPMSRILRIVATICFALAVLGVAPTPVLLVPLGLALWCGSTLVP
jgi:hypothetical protein